MEAFIAFFMLICYVLDTEKPDFSHPCTKPYICKTSKEDTRECLKEAIDFQMMNCMEIVR
jgi:hypothetical protein